MFDIVTVRTRTGKDEEFMSGGAIFVINAKKGLKIPRNMAELALAQNALSWSKENGGVTDSTLYIEDDNETPPAPISLEEVKKIKRTSGYGKDKVLVDGKAVPMKAIDLDPAD
jgi:hypothetical protein